MAAVGGGGASAVSGSAATSGCDAIRAIQHYVLSILKSSGRGSGGAAGAARGTGPMRCLLLDKDTKAIVSLVLSMSDIVSKNVYLVESLDAEHASSTHMEAICILRPTQETLRTLSAHLKAPKFAKYYLNFTNVVNGDALRRLAQEDEAGVIAQVQEHYADYYAVNPDFFHLGVRHSLSMCRPRALHTHHDDLSTAQTQQGLLAMLLSFRVKPQIRYLASSEVAGRVALGLANAIAGERELFSSSKITGQTLLLVLDRREDPLTPLLSPWTYQAMIHQLMPQGIVNNTLNMTGLPGVDAKFKEVDLSPSQDEFYRELMFLNFADACGLVSSRVKQHMDEKGLRMDLSTMDAMESAIAKLPDLQRQNFTMLKHYQIISEINKIVSARHLMDSSRIEQEIAVSDNVVAQVAAIVELLNTVKVDSLDALRLLMVFTLRYEKTRPEKVREVRSLMETRGVLKHSEMAYVDWLLAFGGANVRTGDLFGEASTSALNKFVSAIKPMADVENVYTQHQPAMLSLLSDVAKNKLKPAVYPFTATETPMKYNTVIVFVVGGVTYEEAAMVAAINAGMLSVTEKRVLPTPVPPPFRVVLGGTNIQNSASFMAELQQMQAAGAGAAAGAGTGFM